ncbi:MAG: hypothetical protein M0Q99_08715, partial [Candidatus Cloacimonetes bacterium]|nr:hypothetical protein [Candidatus Cloacimonadota bacterium]
RRIQHARVLFQIEDEDLGGAQLDSGTGAIQYYTGAFTSEYSALDYYCSNKQQSPHGSIPRL